MHRPGATPWLQEASSAERTCADALASGAGCDDATVAEPEAPIPGIPIAVLAPCPSRAQATAWPAPINCRGRNARMASKARSERLRMADIYTKLPESCTGALDAHGP